MASSDMGVAASSFKKGKGDRADEEFMDGGSELWVTLKAKTTCKRTRAVKKKKLQFQPSGAAQTIGSATSCDFVLDDSNLAPLHASIETLADGSIQLRTTGRTYYLIGQGVKTTGPHRLARDQVVKMGACSLQVTDTCITPRNHAEAAADLKKFGDASDPGMCYICFDDTSEEGNELVPSPCSCAKLVHRQCLSRWITTKGSRLCSICKSKLPIDFTVDAPYLVLQVVRHMRGLHWSGEREYIISFNQRATNRVTVGSGADCDLSLPDPSLSRMHSRIDFRDGGFHVEDLTSSAGTFLKLSDTHPLVPDQVAIFKLGRTMLTVKLERRKGMLRSWRSRKPKGKGGLSASPVAHPPGSAASLAALLSPTSVAPMSPMPAGLAAAGAGVGAAPPAVLVPADDGSGSGAGRGPDFQFGASGRSAADLEDAKDVDDGDDDDDDDNAVVALPADDVVDDLSGVEGVEDVEEIDVPDESGVVSPAAGLLSPQSAAASEV